MKQWNEKYCTECGSLIHINAEICPKCGVRQPLKFIYESAGNDDQKSKWITSLLLCWFLGVFGIHRFYTGHTAIGLIQLLTLGGCGIWTFIDLVLLISGSYKDADGNPIKNV